MTEAEREQIAGRCLVLYDGVCGLCNRVVRMLLRVDRIGRFRFAPLESALAAEILARFPAAPLEPEGVILIADALTPVETVHRRFDAVIDALRRLGGPYAGMGLALSLIPGPMREWSYGLIARHRYRVFGRYATCPMPTPAQRARILGI